MISNRNCKVCRLLPEVRDEIHRLKFQVGMSLRDICHIIARDYPGGGGADLNSTNIHNHFKHTPEEARPRAEAPASNPQNLPVLASPPAPAPAPQVTFPDQDRAALHHWEMDVLGDLRRKFDQVREKVELLSDENKGVSAYINLAREIRMAIETLANLEDPADLIGNVSEKFIQKKSVQTQEFLGREFPAFRQRILGLIQPGREVELDDSFRELVFRIQGFERENVGNLRTELRRAFGLDLPRGRR